jgi:hypothetical protein
MSSTGISSKEKAKSTYSLFAKQLYKFFFRSQKIEIIVYGVALLAALIYAFTFDFILGRSRQAVMLEGGIVAAVVLVSTVVGYNLLAIRQDKKKSTSKEVQTSKSSDDRVLQCLESIQATLNDMAAAYRVSQSSYSENSLQMLKDTSTALQYLASQITDSQKQIAHTLSEEFNRIFLYQMEAMAKVAESLTQQLQGSLEETIAKLYTLQGTRVLQDYRNLITHGLIENQEGINQDEVLELHRKALAVIGHLQEKDTRLFTGEGSKVIFEKITGNIPIVLYDQSGNIIKVIFIGEQGVSVFDPKSKINIETPK